MYTPTKKAKGRPMTIIIKPNPMGPGGAYRIYDDGTCIDLTTMKPFGSSSNKHRRSKSILPLIKENPYHDPKKETPAGCFQEDIKELFRLGQQATEESESVCIINDPSLYMDHKEENPKEHHIDPN